MDSIRVSEAPDPGSIPGEATKLGSVPSCSFTQEPGEVSIMHPIGILNAGLLNKNA
jgi:hypothetical protein